MDAIFQLSNITFLYDSFRSAIEGIEWFVAAYFICLVCFFVIGKSLLNNAFVYPFAFMAVTIFNPFLIVPLAEVIGLTTRIRRLFWLLPINLTLAYVFVLLISRPRKWLFRGAAAALCIGFILCCGTFVKPYLQMPENIYKTTDTILEISALIEKDSQETGTDKAALYSSQQLLELRQYDPSIRSILRRTDLLDWNLENPDDETVQRVIDSGHHLHRLALVSRYGLHIDQDVFMTSARQCNANYVISHTDMNLQEYLTSAGYELLDIIDDFEVYRILPEIS